MIKQDPDYNAMRLRMLSEMDEACGKCGDRYCDAHGVMKCRRPDCPGHRVRATAMSIPEQKIGRIS